MSPMTVPDHSSHNNPMSSMRSVNPAGQVYHIFLAKAKSCELAEIFDETRTRQKAILPKNSCLPNLDFFAGGGTGSNII